MIYTKEELKNLKLKLEEQNTISLFNKIKRVNTFIDKNWDKYLKAEVLIKQGTAEWQYSTSLSDITFFVKSQQYFKDLIE